MKRERREIQMVFGTLLQITLLFLFLEGLILPANESTDFQRKISAEIKTISSEKIAAHRQLRKELAARRRVIFNNDGCDALYFSSKKKPTVENFLAIRTSPLAQTDITTYSYCSISSGFGHFTHKTKIGQILSRNFNPLDTKTFNITKYFLEKGTDPLRIVCDFAHKNRKECFWSFRMNDTHDAATRPDKPYPLFPRLKAEHPDLMMGSFTKKTKFGSWTAVNYAKPEIRDLAAQYVEEVCQNYEVDGIELDFCRHLCYFPGSALGGSATAEDLKLMTDLMRTIRQITEIEGIKRDRPILLSIRVPDSVEYSKKIGLDLETWLAERLCDFYMASDYFQLESRADLVRQGHKFGVPVYAGISESRVRNGERFSRSGLEAYRARFDTAWNAGLDGIYIFNVYNPNEAYLAEAPHPEVVAKGDRFYFVTTQYGGYKPAFYLADGESYRRLPVLCPDVQTVIGEKKQIYPIETGRAPVKEDLVKGEKLHVFLAMRLGKMPKGQAIPKIKVSINGKEISDPVCNDAWSDDWLDWKLGADDLKSGINEITVQTEKGQIILADLVLVYDEYPFRTELPKRRAVK